jgi:voltage-gated potassium channel
MSLIEPPSNPDQNAIDLDDQQEQIVGERLSLLNRIQDWLEIPMILLAFLWLALFVLEILWGLTPLLDTAGTVIWVIFILDFVLGSILAPDKIVYVRNNWLKAIALMAPALRIFRIVRLVRLARAAKIARSLRLLRLLSSLNRGMGALAASMGRRGFGYVMILTVLITIAGAAGMYGLEHENADGKGLNTYGDALWWTAMLMTTMGSEYWPRSPEGRMLCFLLALYSFAIFGYVTATLATFFVGRDADNSEAELAGAASIAQLREEIASLRQEIRDARTN